MSRKLELALPLVYAFLLPLLPLLIELAGVTPRGVAVVGRPFAIAIAGIVTVASLISLSALLWRDGMRALQSPPLMPALAALVVTQCIATALGIAWRASIFEVVCQIGNAIAFVVLWHTMSDAGSRRAFLAAFFISGIAACAFAIGLTLSRHPPAAFAYEHGRAAGTFLQPNEFAGYLLFLIPLGLAQSGAAYLRRLGPAAAIVGSVALLMSASRGALLSLLFALPVLVRRFGRRALWIYAGAAAAALVVGLTLLRNVAHDPSENASRIAVWLGAARMAQRFALTGVGPLAFSAAYPLYKVPYAEIDEVHAHDLPLNVLIENGLLGLGALGYVIVAQVAAWRRAARASAAQSGERSLLFFGLTAAFAASALQNSIDLVTTFVFLLWWPMMGLMLGMSRAEAHGD